MAQEIIDKYQPMTMQLFQKPLPEYYTSIYSIDANSIIDHITKSTRTQSVGLFKSSTFKLRDELLPYPNVELVFELNIHDGDSDTCYCSVTISLLDKWLRMSYENESIYELIKSHKKFRSKFNPNWIFISPVLRTGFKLNKELNNLINL